MLAQKDPVLHHDLERARAQASRLSRICSGRTLRQPSPPNAQARACAPSRACPHRAARGRKAIHSTAAPGRRRSSRCRRNRRHSACGVIVELLRRADLHDLAGAHHADPVAQRQRLLLVVGHQDEGDAELALKVLQLDLHLLAQLAVERGQRLVEQQELRLVHDGSRQRHPLLLAARHLPDPADRSKPSAARSRARARPSRRSTPRPAAAPLAQPVGDVGGDGQVREQRVALEHHVHRAMIGRRAR
jgi:hypothetical protein